MSTPFPRLSLADIDADVRRTAPRSHPIEFAPLAARVMPLPEYAVHRDGATEIGKLSAEAVVRDYESAAKEIEAMGAELQDAARKCEAMTSRVHQMVAEVRDLAADYREEGKRIFLQIEEVTAMTEEVRKTCSALKEKIADAPNHQVSSSQ